MNAPTTNVPFDGRPAQDMMKLGCMRTTGPNGAAFFLGTTLRIGWLRSGK
jgi:hypothetical protein